MQLNALVLLPPVKMFTCLAHVEDREGGRKTGQDQDLRVLRVFVL